MLSNKQIALIHVACKDRGISEDDRHFIQETIGGARSLKNMSEQGWMAVMRHLEQRGFTVHGSPFSDGQQTTDYGQRSALLRKLYMEWHELAGVYYEPGKERAALRGFLRKRFGTDHERFLKPEQCIKVIEAVKAINKRRAHSAKGIA